MLIKDIEKMEAYTPTEYVNDSEPDLDADNLNKTERQLRDTVAKANEIIDTLKSLISNVSVNSEDTVPSSAVAYKMEQDIEQLNSNITGIQSQYAALDKENSFTQAQKIISESIPTLQIISGSSGTSKGAFQITARTDINPYSRAAIDLINNGQINGTLYLHEDGFLRWYAHGNTYKINVTQE